jgi:hypothetical protein
MPRRNSQPEPCISAYNSANGSSFTTTAATLPLDSVHAHDTGAFTLNSNEITPADSGTYRVCWAATIYGPSGTRTQVRSWLEANDVEIAGTSRLHYLRQTNMGASGGGCIIRTLTAGQAVRMRAVRTLGSSGAALANGCSLTLERVA